jgi:hypothetical protein
MSGTRKGEIINAYRNLVGKPEETRQDNIKKNLKESGYYSVD